MGKVALTVDPKLFDEVLKPYVNDVMAKDSRNLEMDQMTFGLHESEEYLTLVTRTGLWRSKVSDLTTLFPQFWRKVSF